MLGGDWAGVEPDKVLATQTFFVDVMRNAPALELTVRCWPWLIGYISLIAQDPICGSNAACLHHEVVHAGHDSNEDGHCISLAHSCTCIGIS